MLYYYGGLKKRVVHRGTRQCAQTHRDCTVIPPRAERHAATHTTHKAKDTLKDKLIESSYFITLLSVRKKREWELHHMLKSICWWCVEKICSPLFSYDFSVHRRSDTTIYFQYICRYRKRKKVLLQDT